ncbi:hypothetical protein I2I11_17055 [Pontibacter sp. 172403-2]|uniref:hypothetical protein n=1 Tax=Pontibacter rufus TaxID=2791028 RepID=UPI0018B01108|nr:hypothetical protein [Pontibacter sp. 172403-2]MBF9255012.1 hypothetical protein [Pontibacter sp. 172403-2]
MNTLTNQKQPLTKAQSQQKKTSQQAQQPATNNFRQEEYQQQTLQQQQQEEGLYQQVKQDEALGAYHTAKLLGTPGYTHLTAEEAGGMVEQMLRLTTLLYEMLLEEEANRKAHPAIQGIEEPAQPKTTQIKHKKPRQHIRK